MSDLLHRYKILIADPDIKMANVLKTMLRHMGFSSIQVVTNGQEAMDMVKSSSFDILITEWLGNLELINGIRRDPTSPNPSLPIVTLTGRAELSDVIVARDCGTTEYVVKPFSARSIYSRLERLVEYPRNFVISPLYVGPERRSKNVPLNGITDRRKLQLIVQHRDQASSAINDNEHVKLIAADTSLRDKIGKNTMLSSLITPDILQKAQTSIESISSESLLWIKENLFELKSLQKALMQSNDIGRDHLILMSETALTISSRAGTFGYQNASKIAYMLSLFCRKNLDPDKPIHCVIAEKHIDVLQITLSDTLRNSSTPKDDEIIEELQNLIDKYGN